MQTFKHGYKHTYVKVFFFPAISVPSKEAILLLMLTLHLNRSSGISKMGKGRKWSPEESLHLAESYVDVSEDNGETHVRGTSQDAQVFWSRVYSKFAKRNPGNSPGQYGDRAMSAVSNHWKEKIKLDVRKFNICLRKVYKSKPTGCTDQEKINMAVAIHRGL